MDFANQIKETLSMSEVAERYGLEVSRKYKACLCPFHAEKTPSLKFYKTNKGFRCHGCGASGTVIDFVRLMFDIDFNQAIMRINQDFSLGMPIGAKLSYREKQQMAKAERECKSRIKAINDEKQRVYDNYWTVLEEWIRLDKNRMNYKPTSQDEPLHPLFVEAITKIDYQSYALDCAEIERCEVGV